MVDGMLTESYLDTGNRRVFNQSGNVVSITPPRNLRWDDAAAPLAVSREVVEPLFRQLETRAGHLACQVRNEAQPTTDELGLHLITNAGVSIHSTREDNGRVMFMVPASVQSVRIMSHASRPCDVIGPFVDDRRRLGVLVDEITLFKGKTARWTSGNALLPFGELPIGSGALVVLQIRGAGPYLLIDTQSDDAVLQA